MNGVFIEFIIYDLNSKYLPIGDFNSAIVYYIVFALIFPGLDIWPQNIARLLYNLSLHVQIEPYTI